MKAEPSIIGRIQRRQLKWHGHLLGMMNIVFGQRRFTSGHRTVGGEEDVRMNYRGTKWRMSRKPETWNKICPKIGIFGFLNYFITGIIFSIYKNLIYRNAMDV